MSVTIQTSEYFADDNEQPNGGRFVTERHVDTLGRTIVFGPYLLTQGMDPAVIMAERAQRLNAQFAAQAAETNEAAVGRIPWTKLEFRNLLGSATEQAMDEFMATFESNTMLDTPTKRAVRTGFARWREASYIERPLRPEVLAMLDLFIALGLMSAQQKATIVAAAEAD